MEKDVVHDKDRLKEHDKNERKVSGIKTGDDYKSVRKCNPKFIILVNMKIFRNLTIHYDISKCLKNNCQVIYYGEDKRDQGGRDF